MNPVQAEPFGMAQFPLIAVSACVFQAAQACAVVLRAAAPCSGPCWHHRVLLFLEGPGAFDSARRECFSLRIQWLLDSEAGLVSSGVYLAEGGSDGEQLCGCSSHRTSADPGGTAAPPGSDPCQPCQGAAGGLVNPFSSWLRLISPRWVLQSQLRLYLQSPQNHLHFQSPMHGPRTLGLDFWRCTCSFLAGY